ncbi:MAG: very short patch repair endonuclease [Candidatus Thermoplasmatota archaeon]|nr:very short patch repair endonuclease [Candidatus Thermoplasmatota archaeon]
MARKESPETRSRIMSSIRSSGTAIEKMVGEMLDSLDLDYERHPANIFGKPDFILRSSRVAIFCDGDFWHGFSMKTSPRLNVKNNREYWMKKISANIERDARVNDTLLSMGWKVVRLWEHDINAHPEKCKRAILESTGDP